MAKPVCWIVHFGPESMSFDNRARARGFAMICKARGDANVWIEAKEY